MVGKEGRSLVSSFMEFGERSGSEGIFGKGVADLHPVGRKPPSIGPAWPFGRVMVVTFVTVPVAGHEGARLQRQSGPRAIIQ